VAKNAPWVGDHSVSWITPIPQNLSRIRMAVPRTSAPLAIALTAAASARRPTIAVLTPSSGTAPKDMLLSSVQDLRAPRTPETYLISPHRLITRRQQASQQATFFPPVAGSAKTHSSSHVEKLRREAFSDPAK
jgi:hypothetical protein